MNIITGLEVQGLSLMTEENYNSIPGLWQWNDGRNRIEIGNGKVIYWGDKSVQLNNLVGRGSFNPAYDKNIWLLSTGTQYLTSSRRDFTFLHNGSKFGIYAINKVGWSLDVVNGGFGAVYTSAAGGTGLQGILSTAGNGSVGATLRGGPTQQSRSLTNLLNTGSTNYTPSNTINTQSFVNFGQDNGIKITYGNASITTAPFFPNLSDYPQGPHTSYTVNQPGPSMTYRGGLLLIYNWGAYSDLQVLDFDARVRNLINKDKLLFEQLDI